jgi:hypothetical protein
MSERINTSHFRMSPEARAAMVDYRLDLLRRTKLVECPYCGAARKKPCVSDRGPTKGCHVSRKTAAKAAGYLSGKRLQPKPRKP